MWTLVSRALGLIATVITQLAGSSAVATPRGQQFCVEGTHTGQTACFATMALAEAFMSANTPSYAGMLTRSGYVAVDATTTRVIYDVPDRPPQVLRARLFRIAGLSDSRRYCPADAPGTDPYFPYLCESESSLVLEWERQNLQNGPSCTFSNIQVTGAYGAQHTGVYGSWPGPAGYIFVTGGTHGRRLEWDISCNGEPAERRWVEIARFQSFECPADFRAVSAPVGTAGLPNVCEPTRTVPYIDILGKPILGPCEEACDAQVG